MPQPPVFGQTKILLDWGAPELTNPETSRACRPASLTQEGVAMGAPALLWQALQVAFRVFPTVANEVADPIVTVFVTAASGSIPLLTVNVTLQVPALVTESEVA